MEKSNGEMKVLLKCDHCQRDFNYTQMYYFQTCNPEVYSDYDKLCKECYEFCISTSIFTQ